MVDGESDLPVQLAKAGAKVAVAGGKALKGVAGLFKNKPAARDQGTEL